MTQDDTLDAQRSGAEADISIGREIRRAREVRGISIQQIAQETKINERYLHALENDRLDLLPGQPYTSNFVRAIARTIGADEEELLDYLNYQLKIQQPRGVEAAERRSDSDRSRPLVLAALVVGALLVLSIVYLAVREKHDDVAVVPRATAPASTARPAPAPLETPAASAPEEAAIERPAPPVMAATQASAPSPDPAAVPAEGEAEAPPELKLTFRGPSWVDITQQGKADPVVGLKQPGDVLTYRLDEPLTVTVNNAANVSLSIDGQAGKPLGGARETRTLIIDRRNYRVFLR